MNLGGFATDVFVLIGSVFNGLDASLLARSTTVVRDWRAIFNRFDIQPSGLQRGNRAFATAAGSSHLDLDVFHAEFDCLLGRLLRSQLAGKRRTLSTSFETARARAGPTESIAFCVGDGDLSIVERRIDVHDAVRNVASNFFLLAFCHGM